MSIATAITAAQGRVADCYTAISNKGGTLPATQNLANMPTAINSIQTGTPPKFGMTLDNFIGDVSSGTLAAPSSINGITFTGVTELGMHALKGAFYFRQSRLSGAISFPDLINLNNGESLRSSFYNCNITSVSFENLETITGSNCCSDSFKACSNITSINFPKLKTISANTCCTYMFDSCNNNSFTTISLPSLETISGINATYNMFNSTTKVTSISLPKLKTISGTGAAQNMFSSCGNSASITTVDISALETINGSSVCNSMFSYARRIPSITFTSLSTIEGSGACYGMFHACADMASISFPALTTTSFGSSYINQFGNMFNSTTGSTATGGCTVHFPSNLQSTISGLTGYPTFGGSSSYITLAFDLTATS